MNLFKKKQQYWWGFGVDNNSLKTLRIGPAISEAEWWKQANDLTECRFYILDTCDITKARGQLRAKDKAAGYSWSEVLDKKDNSRVTNSQTFNGGRIFGPDDN